MAKLKDEDIIKAWYTKDNAQACADKLGIEVGALQFWWKQLKMQGRIPSVARNQTFQHSEALGGDGRPCIGTADPLLARLNRFHKVRRG